ncbi:hypothetical protein D9M72_490090 [compost metagenome]
MVYLERLFVAVHRQLALAHDAAGIVGQDVNPWVLLLQLDRQRTHLGEVSEIADEVVSADLLRHGSGLFRRTPDDDHLLPCLGQRPRGGSSDAVASPGNDDGACSHEVSPNR